MSWPSLLVEFTDSMIIIVTLRFVWTVIKNAKEKGERECAKSKIVQSYMYT